MNLIVKCHLENEMCINVLRMHICFFMFVVIYNNKNVMCVNVQFNTKPLNV